MTAALAADGSRWQSAVRPSLAAPGPVLWGIWRTPLLLTARAVPRCALAARH